MQMRPRVGKHCMWFGVSRWEELLGPAYSGVLP